MPHDPNQGLLHGIFCRRPTPELAIRNAQGVLVVTLGKQAEGVPVERLPEPSHERFVRAIRVPHALSLQEISAPCKRMRFPPTAVSV
jgi:hypothetical protein